MSKSIISKRCEVGGTPAPCGMPTAFGYEVAGGGWCALCEEHAKPHEPYAAPIAEILARGGRRRTNDELNEVWKLHLLAKAAEQKAKL